MQLGEYRSFQVHGLQDFVMELRKVSSEIKQTVEVDTKAVFNLSIEFDGNVIANTWGTVPVVVEAFISALEYMAGRVTSRSYVRVQLMYAGSRL